MSGSSIPNPKPAWRKRMAAAQEITHEVVAGRRVARIRLGEEVDYWRGQTPTYCRDCAVLPGQLHVPGCCIERCGICGGQAITCTCPLAPDMDC